MKLLSYHENGIYIVWGVDEKQELRLLHVSSLPFQKEDIKVESMDYGFRFVELQLSGFDRPYERHGNKYIVTAPGYRMKYVSHSESRNENGLQLLFVLRDDLTDVYVDAYVQFYDGLAIVRMWQVIRNEGTETQTVEYISGFNYEGIEKEGLAPRDEKMRVWIPHNSWQRELNWKCYTLPELGMDQIQPERIQRSSGMIRFPIQETGLLRNTCQWHIWRIPVWERDSSGRLSITVPGTGRLGIRTDIFIWQSADRMRFIPIGLRIWHQENPLLLFLWL